MWGRTFQFGWRLRAHDRQFPVESSVALRRGGGGQASGVRERCNGRLLQAETQETKTKNEVTHFSVGQYVVAEAATTTATPVPPSVPATPEAHLKLT